MPFVSQAQAGYMHTHKAELAKEGVDVDEWDRATKGKKLPKRVKKHKLSAGTMVPGDSPGASAMLLAKLDHLIEFSLNPKADALLLAKLKQYPYLRGHAERLGLVPHNAPHWNVSAPSSQVSAAVSPQVPHPHVKPAPLPTQVVQPDTLHIPDPESAVRAGFKVDLRHPEHPDIAPPVANRISLLNQLDKIRQRNKVRQGVFRQQQLRQRPSSWDPDRSLISGSFSARLDRLIQFSTYGWQVRKNQDLVDSSGKVVGGNYATEKAPGVGAFVNRNKGKFVVPPVYGAAGGLLGGYLGSGGYGRFATSRTVRKGALLGTAAGFTLGAAVGSQVDKTRRLLGSRAEAMQTGYEDSLKARGITRQPVAIERKVTMRPTSMSARLDKLIHQFDTRPRDTMGQFTGSSEGVPAPNEMHKTYGQTATNAAIGGASGAVGGGAVGAGGALMKKLIDAAKKRKAKI